MYVIVEHQPINVAILMQFHVSIVWPTHDSKSQLLPAHSVLQIHDDTHLLDVPHQ